MISVILLRSSFVMAVFLRHLYFTFTVLYNTVLARVFKLLIFSSGGARLRGEGSSVPRPESLPSERKHVIYLSV